MLRCIITIYNTPLIPPLSSIDAIDLAAPNVRAELDTGKAYVHSVPDVYGRPVVVIRVQRHVVGALFWFGFLWWW